VGLDRQGHVVQRKVSSRGGIQVAGQRIQVGFPHAGKIVTIEMGDASLRIIDQHGEMVTNYQSDLTRMNSGDQVVTSAGDHMHYEFKLVS
jgi:hypothetical protein